MINDEDLIRLRDQYPELTITRKVSPPVMPLPHILTGGRQIGKVRLFAELLESLKTAVYEIPPERISLEDEMNRLDRMMANGLRPGEMFTLSYPYHHCSEEIWEEAEELPAAKKRRERNQFNGLNANGLPSSKAKRRGGR
jgi:hypothetical protein